MIAREANESQPVPLAGRVLGIDPGLNVTGYAVVEPSTRGPFVVEAGVIRPRSARGVMGQRLCYIHAAIVEVLDAFPPGSVALERIHSHVRYPRTAILMAHARGAIMLAAAQRRTPVFGYAATRIKKTLTGNGRAPKDPDPTRDHDRARLGQAPRTSRRRRCLCRRTLPFSCQPQSARAQRRLNLASVTPSSS